MNLFEEYNSINKNNVLDTLHFINAKFIHNGASGMPLKRDVNTIIEFASRNENKLNCRLLSILLVELLKKDGIKATHITCLPKEELFTDCHVVVEAISSNGKHIMLDPSFNLYFTNDLGTILSTKEVFTAFINNTPIFANKEAKHNNEPFNFEWYKNFMLTCSKRFQRPQPYNACDSEGRLQLWFEDYNFNHPSIGFVVTKKESEFWNF